MPLQDQPYLVHFSILTMSNSLSDLSAMSRTCSQLYSVFHRNETILIFQVLSTELGPVLGDSLALSQIEPFDECSPSYRQQVRDFVTLYKDYLSGNRLATSHELSHDYVTHLVNTHRTMKYLSSLYTISWLSLFEKEVKSSSTATSLLRTPSQVEVLRVTRAFYRLQIAFDVYGKCAVRQRRKYTRGDMECINYRLFGLWEPWELQQIQCIKSFLTRLRRQLTQIPSIDQDWLKESLSMRLYFSLSDLKVFLEELVDQRPEWPGILQKISSFDPEPPMGMYTLYGDELFRTCYHVRCMMKFPHGKYSYPHPISFDGDHVNCVPFAWVDACGGQYTKDFFGREASDERSRMLSKVESKTRRISMDVMWLRLGFVMWDSDRAVALKMEPVLSDFVTGWTSPINAA